MISQSDFVPVTDDEIAVGFRSMWSATILWKLMQKVSVQFTLILTLFIIIRFLVDCTEVGSDRKRRSVSWEEMAYQQGAQTAAASVSTARILLACSVGWNTCHCFYICSTISGTTVTSICLMRL